MAAVPSAHNVLALAAAKHPEVRAVWLYGSHARGTADAASDADVLIIARPRETSLRDIRAAVRASAPSTSLQVVAMSCGRLGQLRCSGCTFATHLAREALAIWDPERILVGLRRGFRPRPEGLRADLERLRRAFAPYRVLGAFNRHYELLLGDCYGLGRSAAMTLMVAAGEAVFDRRVLFQRLAAARPDLASAARTVAQLEPYYLRTRRGVDSHCGVRADDTAAAQAASDACAAMLHAEL